MRRGQGHPSPGRPPRARDGSSRPGTSFRDYVLSRRFHSGRGWKSGWPFVILALGSDDILSASSWPDLRDILLRLGHDDRLKGAYDVWRRYNWWRRELGREACRVELKAEPERS